MKNIYLKTETISKTIGRNNKASLLYDKTSNLNEQALLYRHKADEYYIKNDYIMARESYEKARYFYEQSNNTNQQGNMIKNIGDTYYYTYEYLKAIEMYNNALTLFEKSNYYLGMFEVTLKMSSIFTNVGNFRRSKDMLNKAKQFLEEQENSDDWQKNSLIKKKRDNLKQNDRNDLDKYKENIYGKTKNYHKTLKRYDKKLEEAIKKVSILDQISLTQDKAYLYEEIGDHEKTLQQYDLLLSLHAFMGDIQAEADTFFNQGLLLKKMGHIPNALDCFEKSIAKYDLLRKKTFFPELKKTFFKRFYLKYENIILFMLDNKYHEHALTYVEALKARLFLDQLSEAQVKLENSISPELLKNKNDTIAKLSSLTREITEIMGKRDSKKLTELTKQYRQAEDTLEDLQMKIRLNNPLYASIKYPEPIILHHLQKFILKKGELMVRYFFTQNCLYVFLISQGDFKIFIIQALPIQVENDVYSYLLDIYSRANDYRRIIEKANCLYQKLLMPIEPEMEGKTDIIIIPDGQLTLIPFESLIIGHNKENKPIFFLEKYRVKYMQSASVLGLLRKNEKNENLSTGFIGFGDPVYDYENFKQGKPEKGTSFYISSDNHTMPLEFIREESQRKALIMNRLKYTGAEVEAIANIFKKKNQKCVLFLRNEASEENAKASFMKNFQFIHFACHGILMDDFQSLVLSRIPGAQEDGYLTLNEIMNSKYQAKLVVLSACETGKGKMDRAEGLTGLTHAVMYAGTPAVLASLWKVDDKGTKELMVKFYDNMLEKGMDKQEALRQAKLALIKSDDYYSPFFWSAFVMYGE